MHVACIYLVARVIERSSVLPFLPVSLTGVAPLSFSLIQKKKSFSAIKCIIRAEPLSSGRSDMSAALASTTAAVAVFTVVVAGVVAVVGVQA